MSGSIDYSVLFPGAGGGSSPTDIASLVQSLYSGAAGGGTNALSALRTAETNETQDVAITARQPAIQRAVSQFMAAVGSAKSVSALLQDPTVMKVLLTANGLGDQTQYTALAQKALQADPSDPKSLVNQLTDTRWKTVAQTYQFATKGLSVLHNPQVLSTIANGYAEVAWRQSLNATTPGLSNALTFRNEASTITSVDQILGDSTLRTVVTTALGIPPQIAYQDLGAQEKAISNRLDIGKFQDPHFVESFTQQYLVAAQSQTASSGGASLDALAVQASGLMV